MKFLQSAKEFFIKLRTNVGSFFHKLGQAIGAFFADAKKRRRFIILSAALLTVVLSCALIFYSYVSDYYEADIQAINEATKDSETDIYSIDDGVTVFKPYDAKVGVIFYPGGKVDSRAYAPLMDALASRGVLCVLIEMPFNLAVLDVNAADGIKDHFPQIESWYMAGHSLGGSMAASYLASHKADFEGIILLGAYSTSDLTDKRVMSIYGSEDGVMNREKYDKYKTNLPSDFSEEVIAGGNHAGFGMYGIQEGDGSATITTVEQIEETADAILTFIHKE